MKNISRFIVDEPRTWLAVILLITIFLGYFIKNTRINDDILSYLPAGDTEVQFFKETGENFGGTAMILLALECDDIFTNNNLTKIRAITEELKQHKSVSYVSSITDIIDIRSTDFGLEVADLIDDIPQEKEELEALRKKVMNKDLYLNNLVSRNGKFVSVICKIKQESDHNAVSQDIKKIAEKYRKEFKSIYISGQPVMEDDISFWIKRDMITLIPFVVILVLATLFYGFRTWYGVVLPIATVFISVVWTLGFMNLLGIELNMINEIMPVILVSIGSAYGIHVVNKYMQESRLSNGRNNIVQNTLDHISKPVLMTGITTIIGFLSLLSSNLIPIKEFGFFTAFGVFSALILSLVFIPCTLVVLHPEKRKADSKQDKQMLIDRLLMRLNNPVYASRKVILAVFIVVGIIAVLCIPGIRTESDMSNYFKENSDTRISEKVIGDNFGGARPVQIVVEGDLKDPLVLKEMNRVHELIESLEGINDPTSVIDLISEMNDAMNNRYRIPETKQQVGNLWFFIEGNEILEQMINTEMTEGIIQTKVPNLNYSVISKPLATIKEFIRDEIPNKFVALRLDTLSNEKLKIVIQNKKVEEITEKIEVFFNTNSLAIEKDTIGKIIKNYVKKVQTLTTAEKKHIIREIYNYLTGEEAELVLEKKSLKKVMGSFSSADLALVSTDDISGTISKNVPKKQIEDDPQIVNDLSASLFNLLQSRISLLNILRMKETFISFTDKTKWDEEFTDDFLTVAETLNDKYVSISINDYKTITGSLPDKKTVKTLKMHQTGFPVIMQIIDRQLVRSQLISLCIAIICVFILIAFQFRSVLAGFISCIPIIFTIITNFAIMRLVNIPLDIATTMIAGIAIGIGIDYTIHFKTRFLHEAGLTNDITAILQNTYLSTGRAIVFNALAVSMGFIILILCNLVPLQRFGILTSLTMVISAVSALVLLPILLILLNHNKSNNNK